MIRRRKKRRQQADVSLNLAAMLDMAFQLLAFFILTFRPAPMEGQIKLMLPPPQSIESANAEPKQKPDPGDVPVADSARTLTITIRSAENGQVASVTVGMVKTFDGPLDAGKLGQFDRRLKQIFGIEEAFDQVLLQVGKSLNYGELMKLIEVCTRQRMADGTKVTKISFIELEER